MTTLDVIEFSFIRYFCIVLLIFGTFGNLLNILIFTHPKLRSIPCLWYLLAATCGNSIALYTGCLTRVLSTFGINPQTTLGLAIYCKTRSFFTYSSLSLSVWFVIGACIDRWASSCTNVRIRSMSNVKTAERVIIALAFLIYLSYAQMFFCFDGIYQSNTSNCFTISATCELTLFRDELKRLLRLTFGVPVAT